MIQLGFSQRHTYIRGLSFFTAQKLGSDGKGVFVLRLKEYDHVLGGIWLRGPHRGIILGVGMIESVEESRVG